MKYMKTLSAEVVVAYFQCPRKAFLILSSEGPVLAHEYVSVLEEKARRNRCEYLDRFKRTHPAATTGNATNFLRGEDFLLSVQLGAKDLAATCDLLKKVQSGPSPGTHRYEPTHVVGTYHVSKEQKLEALFAGYVLGQLQNRIPAAATIVDANGCAHKIDMASASRVLVPAINVLREWASDAAPPPPIILNKHCSLCQFHKSCLDEAIEADDLSLLNRITPKNIHKYHKKGIFTVTQLSYVFKARRKRKRRGSVPTLFNVELQALALRTQKIYVQELPVLNRHDVEVFLDFEGVPDEGFQYLIGLLIIDRGIRCYHSFWANAPADEEQMWTCALEKINTYPEAPVYHYGSYEPRAIDNLAKRYPVDLGNLKTRLVNLSGAIYGRLYFPSKSNNLKELGRFLGASWTDPEASGLRSLVWRHHWEETGEGRWQNMLITYNREDCEALWLLTEEVTRIIANASADRDIEFADRTKQYATEHGAEIHEQFDGIIRSAHSHYERGRISIRSREHRAGGDKKQRGAPKGHLAYARIQPSQADAVVQVELQKTCPKHQEDVLLPSAEVAAHYVTDLRFTRRGCRKTITKYVGPKTYCPKCRKHYPPPQIRELGGRFFGHAFKAWVIYERIVLRLPYRIIVQEMENLFNETVSGATLVSFMKSFADHYAESEKLSIQRLLQSPFIHADETIINVQGVDHYVWVFTDGKRAVFRMTETREAAVVREFLGDYTGVLISDFYGGYDGARCRQQKCLVHLIRDLNNDLWNNPYDHEYEAFVTQVRNLLVPIFAAEQRYGLKKRHLSKFKRSIERFYQVNIDVAPSNCEVVAKYQKRFARYRDSLFVFLESDGIPWHNNTAENAIRHLAVQRKISGTFFKKAVPQYLLLLGVAQTCRFQGKSVLRFFLSEELDIDAFKAGRRITRSYLIDQHENAEEED